MKNYIIIFISLIFMYSCSKTDISNENIFIGDSHIERWDLNYYFPDKIKINNGVGGETINELKKRFEIIEYSNNTYFIIIGINDYIANSREKMSETLIPNTIINDYDSLLIEISRKSNDVYIFSLFPLGENEYSDFNNSLLPIINQRLESLINNYNNIHFINVYDILVDENRYLKNNLSLDGLHLNSLAYSVLQSEIRRYVK